MADSRSVSLPPASRLGARRAAKASRVSDSSTQVWLSTAPEATIVLGGALTIAHQRPSVTIPIGTPAACSIMSIRSMGLVAHPSSSRSCMLRTGSMTHVSAAVVWFRRNAPVLWTVTRTLGETTSTGPSLTWCGPQPKTRPMTRSTQASRAAR